MSKKKLGRRHIAVGIAVILVLAPAVPFVLSWIKVATGWPTETTNVWQYSQIKKRWRLELVAHFPESIPKGARNVRLSSRPGFLQGGSHLQVAYTLPAEQIKQHLVNFESQGKASYQGGSSLEHYNEDNRNGLPIASYVTSESGTHSFPHDFTVVVLGAKAYSYHEGMPNWNHGYSYGVAISLEKNEIVFWAEDW